MFLFTIIHKLKKVVSKLQDFFLEVVRCDIELSLNYKNNFIGSPFHAFHIAVLMKTIPFLLVCTKSVGL